MHNVTILLVDDQPGKLLSYQAILTDLGGNLVTAKSGREALQYLLNHEVALILLDVNMPGMDGFEATRQIMANWPVPVVNEVERLPLFPAPVTVKGSPLRNAKIPLVCQPFAI